MRPLAVLIAASTTHLIFRFFRRLGIVGVLMLSTLDSSFLFLPFGNDLLLIALIGARPHGLKWMAYVLVSAGGSVLGVLLVDLMMRKTGEKGLEKFVARRRLLPLKKKIENKAGLTVFITTLLPPPFPFTPVIMTASALQYSRRKLLLTVFVGRLVRFTLEALLAIYFGSKIIAYLNSDYVVYAVYGLIVIAVVGSVISILKWRNTRQRDLS